MAIAWDGFLELNRNPRETNRRFFETSIAACRATNENMIAVPVCDRTAAQTDGSALAVTSGNIDRDVPDSAVCIGDMRQP